MRTGISSAVASKSRCGATLVEVVTAAALIALVYGGVIKAYILSSRRAEWSAYSLAAQGICMRQLEQVHAAMWDNPVTDEIKTNTTGFAKVSTVILDLPVSGNNKTWVTNYLSLTDIASYYNVLGLKMIKVDSVWAFKGRLFTNTVATYIGPDQ